MNLMENYNSALQKIYDHVGYNIENVIFPIDDCTQHYWKCTDNTVIYGYKKSDVLENNFNEFCYKEDLLPKNKRQTYCGENLTAVICFHENHSWFRIFNNENEIKQDI